jgi:tRNA pseudouridine55 synthase
MTPTTSNGIAVAAAGGVDVSRVDGIVVVDKPAGLTSHTVVARIRKLAGTRKVGHAGTLDPMATGVLVVGLNRATRLLGHLQVTDKSYDATVCLGASTTTDDAEGEIVQTAPAAALAALTPEAIEAAVAGFRGRISQVPSKVSAIKVDGRRSYERVRAGEEVALKARLVTVSRYDVTDIRSDASTLEVDISVDCSSGTYIRALARDLGAELGVGGHLSRLRRTRVGSFDLESASTLDELAESFTVRPIALQLASGLTAMFGPDGTFLALYEPRGPVARPTSVFVG